LIEDDGDRGAVFTHYLHNRKNGISRFYRNDAIEYAKEILGYEYPEEEITTVAAEEALQYGVFEIF
jgi:DNA (cytosine-5)-methyltransferase 1